MHRLLCAWAVSNECVIAIQDLLQSCASRARKGDHAASTAPSAHKAGRSGSDAGSHSSSVIWGGHSGPSGSTMAESMAVLIHHLALKILYLVCQVWARAGAAQQLVRAVQDTL